MIFPAPFTSHTDELEESTTYVTPVDADLVLEGVTSTDPYVTVVESTEIVTDWLNFPERHEWLADEPFPTKLYAAIVNV